MTSRAAILREKQVLEYLTDNEAGANAIAVALDIPYVSVRRILTKLEGENKIKLSGYGHGQGGYKYRTVSTDPMPHLIAFGNNLPAIIILNEMAERAKLNGGRFTSEGVSDSTHYVAKSLATLFHEAYRVAEEGYVDEKEMRGARDALNKAEKTFAEMARLCRQILDDRTYWDESLLIKLPQSQYWGSRQVLANYDVFTIKD